MADELCTNLMIHPKWFRSDIDPQVGDVVLFLKSDKELEKLYNTVSFAIRRGVEMVRYVRSISNTRIIQRV